MVGLGCGQAHPHHLRLKGQAALRNLVSSVWRVGVAGVLAGLCAAWAVAAADRTGLPPARPPSVYEVQAYERSALSSPDETLLALSDFYLRQEAGSLGQLHVLYITGIAYADVGDFEKMEQTVGEVAQFGVRYRHRKVETGLVAGCLQAEYQRRRGTLIRADELFQRTLSEQTLATMPEVHVRCMALHAQTKQGLGHLADAVNLYQAAIPQAKSLPVWLRISLRNNLAYTLWIAGQREAARELHAAAKSLALNANDPLMISEVMTVEAILLTVHEEDEPVPLKFREALKHEEFALTKATAAAVLSGSRYHRALTLANQADFYLRTRDYAKAYDLAQQGYALARGVGDLSLGDFAQFNTGLALLGMRRKDEGQQVLNEVLARVAARGDMSTHADFLEEQGRYLERIGDYWGALAAYRQAALKNQQAKLNEQQRVVLGFHEQFMAEQRKRDAQDLVERTKRQEAELRSDQLRLKLWWLSATMVVLMMPVLWLWYARIRATQNALRRSNQRLTEQTETDVLTGLANRHHWQHHVAAREMAAGALYLIDLDHFKRINDQHGHAMGDAVLVEVARRLRTVVREQDLVLRWGGEEFLVLVRDDGMQFPDALAQRLLGVLAARPIVLPGGGSVPLSGSLGYSVFPLAPGRLEVSWDVAVELVDAAMYQAKMRGRNRAWGVLGVQATSIKTLETSLRDLETACATGQVVMVEHLGPTLTGHEPQSVETAALAKTVGASGAGLSQLQGVPEK